MLFKLSFFFTLALLFSSSAFPSGTYQFPADTAPEDEYLIEEELVEEACIDLSEDECQLLLEEERQFQEEEAALTEEALEENYPSEEDYPEDNPYREEEEPETFIDVGAIEDKVYEDERLLDSDDPDAIDKTIEEIKRQQEVDIEQEKKKKDDLKNFKKTNPCDINPESPLCLLQTYIKWVKESNRRLITFIWKWKP